MSLFDRIFTWWNGHTIGTQLYTRRHGQRVGEDEQGNVYYQAEGGKRRWVIYNGESEASRISPDWHGWMHHTFDQPPTVAPLRVKPWEKPHAPNLTGTAGAYAPPGAVTGPTSRARATGDYQAWVPE
jgi:NADH:ubiquinone oxidoreductase subunit